MESTKNAIDLSIGKLSKTGMIHNEMQSLGDSPRIQPLDTKYATNGFKKPVARLGLQLMAIEAKKRGHTILDLDLKSCYASTILGLYPQQVTLLKKALEKGGLWNYIEEEFDSWGRKEDYVKSYVKAAVYASCFGAGPDGFKRVILERNRKDLGLVEEDFKKLESYGKSVQQAENLAKTITKSNVLKSFKQVASHFKKLYVETTLVGPTGYTLVINQENVRSQYSNYLQDFESAIKCEFTLRLIERFKGVELLVDLHDGVTVTVPTHMLEEINSFLETETNEIGKGLGLKHKQVMEIADDTKSLLKEWNY